MLDHRFSVLACLRVKYRGFSLKPGFYVWLQKSQMASKVTLIFLNYNTTLHLYIFHMQLRILFAKTDFAYSPNHCTLSMEGDWRHGASWTNVQLRLLSCTWHRKNLQVHDAVSSYTSYPLGLILTLWVWWCEYIQAFFLWQLTPLLFSTFYWSITYIYKSIQITSVYSAIHFHKVNKPL